MTHHFWSVIPDHKINKQVTNSHYHSNNSPGIFSNKNHRHSISAGNTVIVKPLTNLSISAFKNMFEVNS